MQTQTRMRAHAHTYSHTQTREHTYTHTYARMYSRVYMNIYNDFVRFDTRTHFFMMFSSPPMLRWRYISSGLPTNALRLQLRGLHRASPASIVLLTKKIDSLQFSLSLRTAWLQQRSFASGVKLPPGFSAEPPSGDDASKSPPDKAFPGIKLPPGFTAGPEGKSEIELKDSIPDMKESELGKYRFMSHLSNATS